MQINQDLADLLTQLVPMVQAENQEISRTVQAVRELLPTNTPGLKLLTISRDFIPEVVVRCDTKIDDLFGMRVKTPEAKATLAQLRADFEGVATFAVEPK